MSSDSSIMSDSSLSEVSPTVIFGETSVEVEGLHFSEGYYNTTPFQPHSPPTPVYFPVPSFYQLTTAVSAVEVNGTTFYTYHQYAVPMYSYLYYVITPVNTVIFDVNDVDYQDLSPNGHPAQDVENTIIGFSDPDETVMRVTIEEMEGIDVQAEEVFSEESLDSKSPDSDGVVCTDVSPELIECDKDNFKIDKQESVVLETNESVKETSDNLLKENEFVKELDFNNFNDGEFEIDANFSDTPIAEFRIESSFDDVDDIHFDPSTAVRNVRNKIRFMNRVIEIMPTIFEEDEPLESDEDVKGTGDKYLLSPTKMHTKERDKEHSDSRILIDEDGEKIGFLVKDDEEVNRAAEKILARDSEDKDIKEECNDTQPMVDDSETNDGLKEATEMQPSTKSKKKRFKGLRRLFASLACCCKKYKEPPPE